LHHLFFRHNGIADFKEECCQGEEEGDNDDDDLQVPEGWREGGERGEVGWKGVERWGCEEVQNDAEPKE
jgi:hypothetical protein